MGREVVVSGFGDRTVRIWDAATGFPLYRPLAGHDDQVTAVQTWRSGGRDVIVSGGGDQTLLLREHHAPVAGSSEGSVALVDRCA